MSSYRESVWLPCIYIRVDGGIWEEDRDGTPEQGSEEAREDIGNG